MKSCPVIGVPPPSPQIRLKVLVAGLILLKNLNNFIDKRSTEMFSSNFSTHTVVTPLAQHFCRDKSQQMLTKSELIFLRVGFDPVAVVFSLLFHAVLA